MILFFSRMWYLFIIDFICYSLKCLWNIMLIIEAYQTHTKTHRCHDFTCWRQATKSCQLECWQKESTCKEIPLILTMFWKALSHIHCIPVSLGFYSIVIVGYEKSIYHLPSCWRSCHSIKKKFLFVMLFCHVVYFLRFFSWRHFSLIK